MSEVLKKIREKYPQYNNLEDGDLAGRILDKFPQYGNTDLASAVPPSFSATREPSPEVPAYAAVNFYTEPPETPLVTGSEASDYLKGLSPRDRRDRFGIKIPGGSLGRRSGIDKFISENGITDQIQEEVRQQKEREIIQNRKVDARHSPALIEKFTDVAKVAGRDPEKLLAEAIPFYGGFYTAADLSDIRKSAVAIGNGEGTVRDHRRIAGFFADAEIKEEMGVGATALDLLRVMPAFMTEFIASGPVHTATKTATAKAGVKAIKKVTKGQIKKSLRRKLAIGAGGAVGIGAQAAANPQLFARQLMQKRLEATLRPMWEQLKEPDRIAMEEFLADESWGDSIWASMKATGVEIGSERSGYFLRKFLRKLAAPVKAAMVKAAQRVGIAPDDFLKMLKTDGVAATMKKVFEKAGYHGPLEEMGEEQVAQFANAALGVEPYEFVGWKNIKAQAIAFSVPGAAVGAASTPAALEMVRAENQLRAELVQHGSERMFDEETAANLLNARDLGNGRYMVFTAPGMPEDGKLIDDRAVQIDEKADATESFKKFLSDNPGYVYRGTFQFEKAEVQGPVQEGEQRDSVVSAGRFADSEIIRDPVALGKHRISAEQVAGLTGREVEETDTGYSFKAGNQDIRIDFVGRIEDNAEAKAVSIAADHAGSLIGDIKIPDTGEKIMALPDESRNQILDHFEVSGSFSQTVIEGEPVPDGYTIKLAGLQPLGKLRHEVMHWLKATDQVTTKEWQTLTDRYGNADHTEKDNEEAVAYAYENYVRNPWDDTVLGRILKMWRGVKGVQDSADTMRAIEDRPKVPGKSSPAETRHSIAPVFHSGLEKAIQSDVVPAKGGGNQVLSTILKQPGVKSEEVEWLGLREFLSGKKKVTKEELQQWISANKLEIQEVEKGDSQGNALASSFIQNYTSRHDIKQVGGKWVATTPDGDSVENSETGEDFFETEEAAREEVLSQANDIATNGDLEFVERFSDVDLDDIATKFGEYTLPGGENYKELLITLPESGEVAPRPGDRVEQIHGNGKWRAVSDSGLREVFDTEQEARSQLIIWAKNSGARPEGTFTGSHWDEPNVVAHIRLNEREDADGNRILFIEEVQSDWHQKGRKEGYGSKKAEADKVFNEAVQAFREQTVQAMIGQGFEEEIAKELTERVISKGDSIEILRSMGRLEEYSELMRTRDRVPDAPFKKSWPLLTMKRVIRYAAENGFDSIAWTTGEQQAERYDLSKKVKEVFYDAEAKELSVIGLDSSPIIDMRPTEVSELPDIIGKDVADRLIDAGAIDPDTGYHTISGGDLKVGGKGMLNFYDKELPSIVNKFVRKIDKAAKVGTVELDHLLFADVLTTQHSLKITDKIRSAALGEGFPMFSVVEKGGYLGFIDSVLDKPGSHNHVTASLYEGGKVRSIAKMFKDIMDKTKSLLPAEDNIEVAGDRILAVMERAIYEFPNFASWYEGKLNEAMSIFTEMDPGVSEPGNKAALTLLMAVTSNGAGVYEQTEDSWRIYKHYKQTGKLSGSVGRGSARSAAINSQLETIDSINNLLGGMDKVGEFFSRKGTVKELRSALVDLGYEKKAAEKLTNGELIDEIVPFSLVFGPKLGSFFNNLNGDFSTVTMDRWFMRTFGRAMNRQFDKVSEKKRTASKRFRDAVKNYNGPILKHAGTSKSAPLSNQVSRLWKYFVHAENRIGLSNEENELRKSANGLIKVGDGLELREAPATGRERRWIRQVMLNAIGKFNKKTGKNMNPAESQALLWYYEKLIHENLGSIQRDSNPDYAAAARRVFEKELGRAAQTSGRADSSGVERRPDGRRGATFGGDGRGERTVSPGQFSVTPISPAAQSQINIVEGYQNLEEDHPERPPGGSAATDFVKRHISPRSQKLLYFSGGKLAKSHDKLMLDEAYQAKSVNDAVDRFQKRMEEVLKKSAGGWWLRGAARKQMNAFNKMAPHIAARLNATSRDSRGEFTFEDFEARAGYMSAKNFKDGKHAVGDRILNVTKSLEGIVQAEEELIIGSSVKLPNGKQGYQLLRPMSASVQQEIWQRVRESYPQWSWIVEEWIDPAIKGDRVFVNGVEVPTYNRFSLGLMMKDNDSNFEEIPGYTPDVIATRVTMGSIVSSIFGGAKSPGRKYKTGSAREKGKTKNLIDAWAARSYQVMREKTREKWVEDVLRYGTRSKKELIDTGDDLTGYVAVPDAIVSIENAYRVLSIMEATPKYKAVSKAAAAKARKEGKTITQIAGKLYVEEPKSLDDAPAEVKSPVAARMKAKAGIKDRMIKRELVDALTRHVVNSAVQDRGLEWVKWMTRNSKQLLLAMPQTYVVNVISNDFFTMEAATFRFVAGAAKILSKQTRSEGRRDLRMAVGLSASQITHRFHGWGGLAGTYREVVDKVLPDEVFENSANVQDLQMTLRNTPWENLMQGEIGAAVLKAIKYSNIDVRAKQRFAYEFLKATAHTEAQEKGLKGKARTDYVQSYMLNPPHEERIKAISAANFEFLNYSDAPEALEKFAASGLSPLALPFPRFGYAFLSKQITRATAVKDVVMAQEPGQRAEAFGNIAAFGLFGAGGLGLLAMFGMGDDDDAREVFGSSTIIEVDPITGEQRVKQLPRELITANRMNLSYWARAHGIDLPGKEGEDFWLRTRNYPVMAMAGNAVIALKDAEKHGVKRGAASYMSQSVDLLSDFFSMGAAIKVPDKLMQAAAEFNTGRQESMKFDPYGSSVPTSFYITEQAMSGLVPGKRQAEAVMDWIDPEVKRKSRSKSLDYHPDYWDALKMTHFGGLIYRASEENRATMTPQGSVKTVSGNYRRGEDPSKGDLRREGRRLVQSGSPRARAYTDHYGKSRLALIPEDTIRRMPRSLQAVKHGGLNLRPYNRDEYMEAIYPPAK